MISGCSANPAGKLTKARLVGQVASACALSLREAEQLVDLIFNSMAKALIHGERIEVRGFGSLFTTERGSRTGKNPRTGEAVAVPAKRIARFRASRSLLNRIDGELHETALHDLGHIRLIADLAHASK